MSPLSRGFGLSRTVYLRFYGFRSVFLDIFELKFHPREAYGLIFIHFINIIFHALKYLLSNILTPIWIKKIYPYKWKCKVDLLFLLRDHELFFVSKISLCKLVFIVPLRSVSLLTGSLRTVRQFLISTASRDN